MTYAPWGAHLASYGFVVIAANYDTGLTDAPDAGISLTDRVPIWLLYARPTNVVRVIEFADALTAPDGKLAGVIDTSQVGVWGHSTGGSTALQAAGARINFRELDAWCAANPTEQYGESCQFVGHERPVATLYGSADPFAGPLPPIWDNRVRALALAHRVANCMSLAMPALRQSRCQH
jgi:predicted dienelactone hydrolase